MTNATIEITARAKAFTSEPVRQYKFRVELDGSVLVWDSVAGHYTQCHSLSESAKKRIVDKAKDAQYRFENGTLYQLRNNTYICCFKTRATSKRAAIREYESL